MSIEIIQGDCIQVLPTLTHKYDVILIDPPYGTGNTKNKAATYDQNIDFQRKNWQSFYADWDTIAEYQKWCYEWLTLAKPLLTETGTIFICGSFHSIPDTAIALKLAGYYTIQWIQFCIPNAFPNLSMTKMVNSNQTIIWARAGKRHYYDKEAAKRYNNGKNLRDYWLINNDTQAGKLWKHPSKKPVELVYRALDIAMPKQDNVRVLDFFSGSGTSGVAGEMLAKNYSINVHTTLIDQSAEYVEMMQKRLCTITPQE